MRDFVDDFSFMQSFMSSFPHSLFVFFVCLDLLALVSQLHPPLFLYFFLSLCFSFILSLFFLPFSHSFLLSGLTYFTHYLRRQNFEGKLSVSPYFLHHFLNNNGARTILKDKLSLEIFGVYILITF